LNINSESRLDLGYDLGAISSIHVRGNRMPSLSADTVQNTSEFNFRRSWSIGTRNISYEKISKLAAFYSARKGTLQRFRYKDWSDFYALQDGVDQQGYLGVGNGAINQFQLIKRYLDVEVTERTITKPIANTVAVYFNGSVQSSGWSVDATTGLVTFAVAPANGVVITADFEFDVRAKFTSENFTTKFLAYKNKAESIHNLPALTLREV